MRNLLIAIVVATLACGSEPAPSCGAIGRSAPCACPGGAQGAQECGPLGVWGVCACPDGGSAEAGADAGDAPALEAAVDAPAEAGIDAVSDASPATDSDGGDAAPTMDVAPGCRPEAPASCVTPGFGAGCWNLDTSNGQVPAMNCGTCGRACSAAAPRCVGGRCSE